VAAGAWWWSPPQIGPGAPKIPRVLVEKFDDLTGTQASAAITSGLAQEVAGQLSKFKDLVVLSRSKPHRARRPCRRASSFPGA
jgi:TolB-like protein